MKWQVASKIKVHTKWDPQTLSTTNQKVKIKHN